MKRGEGPLFIASAANTHSPSKTKLHVEICGGIEKRQRFSTLVLRYESREFLDPKGKVEKNKEVLVVVNSWCIKLSIVIITNI